MTRRALGIAALAVALEACGGPTARLRVIVDGDGSTAPSAGTYTYEVGSTIRVTAYPASGATFTGWEGGASGLVNPLELLLDGDTTLFAHFSRVDAGPWKATRAATERSLEEHE